MVQEEEDGTFEAVLELSRRAWRDPKAPTYLIFVDRQASPTRDGHNLHASFGPILAGQVYSDMAGLQAMGLLSESVLVVETHAVSSSSNANPQERQVLWASRQSYRCPFQMVRGELEATTVPYPAALQLKPDNSFPLERYLNKKTILVFFLVIPADSVTENRFRRAITTGGAEWEMPTAFIPWGKAQDGGDGDALAIVQQVWELSHTGGLVIAFVDQESLQDGTVCIVSTSESELSGLPEGRVTTQGRLPAKDVASATGGMLRGGKDIARDLELTGRLDYHHPRLDEVQATDPSLEDQLEAAPRPEDLPTPSHERHSFI